jgi:hypothetical protein
MIPIYVKAQELFNEETMEFIKTPAFTLKLEHSLLSISKWESKWHKSFIDNLKQASGEEILDYIRCMTLNNVPDDNIYKALTNDNIKEIVDYINDPMTATTVNDRGLKRGGSSGSYITNELVYYWMTVFHIPFECEKWHFNRLMTLIKVCNAKNQPSKKMSKGAIMNRNKALNDARRAQLNSKG